MGDLDPTAVVVSVVYDGPPFAGKTTSVRALARSFGREVHTPEERDGRTQFYDWLDHIGGRFDGAPIRCQIVSVPGQEELAQRRDHFIDRADVVVFVADTSAEGWPLTLQRLSRLRERLDAREGTPVGLVFQANKRDAADAVPLAQLEEAAASARTTVIESIASEGSGVREAFVFAIRLALDRVRGDGVRDRGGFGGDPGPELVQLLERLGAPPLLPPPPPPVADPEDVTEPLPPPPVVVDATLPRPPWHDVLSGFVWPPVEGRILLREAAPVSGEKVQVTGTGDLFVGLGSGWRVHSNATAEYAELESARAALISWARVHASVLESVSRRRCIVLAETGHGGWRLWQIVECEPSLRDLVVDNELAFDEAWHLVDEVRTTASLPCSLETVGIGPQGKPIYVGLMPTQVAS